MAALYPGQIRTFTNPLSTDYQDTVPHDSQHTLANDEINAIETELGTAPSGTFSDVATRLSALGSYAFTPSYTITNSGGTYSAFNSNGVLGTSGTDASIVAKHAIDGLPALGGQIFFKAGTYNFYTSTLNQTVYVPFLLGNGTAIDNIHIRGEGMDATVLKYAGTVLRSSFIKTWYEPASPGAADGAQTGISVTNLTADCNGLIEGGVVFQYAGQWLIENVRTKNHNIFNAGDSKAGVAIYSSYGYLHNVWIDPPQVTADTVTTQSELLNTSLIFDSANCHEVFADGVFLDGNDTTISKSAISFEDDPYNVWLNNVHIRRFQNGITSAQNTANQNNFHYSNVYITDCGAAINLPIKTDYVSFKNVYISEIDGTVGNNVVSIKGNNINIDGMYFVNAPNVAGSWVDSLHFENTQNVKINKLFISNSKCDGVRILDGCKYVTIDNSFIGTCNKHGLYMAAISGGAQPVYNKILNTTFSGNGQLGTASTYSGILEGGSVTVIRGCDFIDTQGTATQYYGVNSTGGTTSKITDCYFAGNAGSAILGTCTVKRNLSSGIAGGDD